MYAAQKPWAKPAGNPRVTQPRAASETFHGGRVISARSAKTRRHSITSSLPAAMQAEELMTNPREGPVTNNPLSLIDNPREGPVTNNPISLMDSSPLTVNTTKRSKSPITPRVRNTSLL